MKKKIYLNDNSVLKEFYEAVRQDKLNRIHIPHSDVFYVRAAIKARSGIKYSLERIEIAMKKEGWNKQNMAFQFLTGAAALARGIIQAGKYLTKKKRTDAIKSYKDTSNRKKLYNPDKKNKVSKDISRNKFKDILDKHLRK